MSFRIDDILKKEDQQENNENCERAVLAAAQWQQSVDCSSILEQTLMRSYTNATGGYKQTTTNPCDLYTNKLLSSWYNCDKVSYIPVHYDSYVEKANSYLSPYPRRLWPIYSSIPFIMPYQYAHYTKRKGGQVRFTATQTDALEKRFNSNKYLSPEDRRLLADSLKLTDRQVKTWFQNRRAKWRRCNNSTLNTPSENPEESSNSESETDICDTSQHCPLAKK